uniref:Uncharacterized protein n=1 Tax=Branchiostoma floridae TaxID=7739 RepID=C3Y4K8_BRAFL|eukprot:XP_002608655.1 hypothetical protein BRAFLDRAFT_73879 [Branchiostoma floridae]
MDELASILQERRNVMIEKSRNMEKDKTKRLENEETKRREELKKCAAVASFADEVTKETDQACFLQAVKATNDRVTKTTPTEDSLKMPCDGDFPSPTFRGLVRLLRHLHFFPDMTDAVAEKIKFKEHEVDGKNIIIHWEDSDNTGTKPGVQYELQWQKEGDGNQWVTISDISKLSCSLKLPEGSYVMHWIRLEVKEGMSPVHSLAMKLPNRTVSWEARYKPPHVAVYGGNNFDSLTLLSEVNIGQHDDDVTLLKNLDKVYRCFEIRIDKLKSKSSAFQVCQLQGRAREITATQISQYW